ncbi:hypothetical protein BG011_007818 [Mortierella polycephala]|uniref:Uncharacterized protein n=1 Tax=Mortierella polycephala TaxID=41804 RepID=A0A9P6PP90_9FUNG|nr:hypothetical protein BG011_007818 [Mortierella polycephala]
MSALSKTKTRVKALATKLTTTTATTAATTETKATKARATRLATAKPQKNCAATAAMAMKQSLTEVPPPCKELRRGIPLDLKEQFLQDVEAERRRDPKISLSSIGIWSKYNFNNKVAARIFIDADGIRLKVQELGPQNSKTITKMYPRKMEAIEKALLTNLKGEIARNI